MAIAQAEVADPPASVSANIRLSEIVN